MLKRLIPVLMLIMIMGCDNTKTKVVETYDPERMELFIGYVEIFHESYPYLGNEYKYIDGLFMEKNEHIVGYLYFENKETYDALIVTIYNDGSYNENALDYDFSVIWNTAHLKQLSANTALIQVPSNSFYKSYQQFVIENEVVNKDAERLCDQYNLVIQKSNQ